MGIITTSRSTTEYSRCVPYEPTLWRTHPRGAPQIRTLPCGEPTLMGHRKSEPYLGGPRSWGTANTSSRRTLLLKRKLLVSQLHKTPSEPCTVSSSTDHRLVRA